ncbi:hypothetical protein BP5796_05366 [Coleophoma crateriformis]|uniref:Uncharacterized protein n=1 Tax=Coleophoma crateriformis TaxID=565419 RepID=A0A3D8S323_9HELO|nr:hypothetical protein BP5796_05366 [Coleophoma crateriformis]
MAAGAAMEGERSLLSSDAGFVPDQYCPASPLGWPGGPKAVAQYHQRKRRGRGPAIAPSCYGYRCAMDMPRRRRTQVGQVLSHQSRYTTAPRSLLDPATPESAKRSDLPLWTSRLLINARANTPACAPRPASNSSVLAMGRALNRRLKQLRSSLLRQRSTREGGMKSMHASSIRTTRLFPLNSCRPRHEGRYAHGTRDSCTPHRAGHFHKVRSIEPAKLDSLRAEDGHGLRAAVAPIRRARAFAPDDKVAATYPRPPENRPPRQQQCFAPSEVVVPGAVRIELPPDPDREGGT